MERDAAVAAARSVASVAGEQASESERGRRLAAPVVSTLERSSLNRLISPTALGGHAADPMMLVEVVEVISAADASAGWCAGIGMGSNFLGALITEAAAKEIFTDLDRGGRGRSLLADGASSPRMATGYRAGGPTRRTVSRPR